MKYLFYFTATLLLLFQPAKNGDSQIQQATPVNPNTELIKKVDAKQQEISALIDKIPEPKKIIQYRTRTKTIYIHDTVLIPVPDITADYFNDKDTILIHDTITIRKPFISILSRKNKLP